LSKFPSDQNPETSFVKSLDWIAPISLFVIFWWISVDPIPASNAAEPHPWISNAPPQLARLIDLGQVKIMVDDKAVKNAKKTAATFYSINVQYDLRYIQTPIRQANTASRKTSIQVKFTNPKITLEHEVKLSSSYWPEKPWESRLLLHEMEHVAISTDPRLIKILKSLLRLPAKLTIDLSDNAIQDATTISRAIDDLQRARREAVQKIVQRYYERFDIQSNNGLVDIDQRNAFFMGLYSKQDLESLEFPYLKEIRAVLTDTDSEIVANHYLISDSK
jgi:hypothetical protein